MVVETERRAAPLGAAESDQRDRNGTVARRAQDALEVPAVGGESVEEHEQGVGRDVVVGVRDRITDQPWIALGQLADFGGRDHELALDQRARGQRGIGPGVRHRPAQRDRGVLGTLPALLRILGQACTHHPIERLGCERQPAPRSDAGRPS